MSEAVLSEILAELKGIRAALEAKPATSSAKKGDKLTITGKVEKYETENGWNVVYVEGMKFSTKDFKRVDGVYDGAFVAIEYTEYQKGKFTNRYIDKLEVLAASSPAAAGAPDDDAPF